MDLNERDYGSATAELAVIDPATMEPSDLVITLRSADSKEYRVQAQRNADDEITRQANAKTQEERLRTAAASRAQETRLLASCVVGWKGLVIKGQELPANPENIAFVLETYEFIRAQVETFVYGRRNFIKVSAPAS